MATKFGPPNHFHVLTPLDDDPELLVFPDFFLLHASGCGMPSSSQSRKGYNNNNIIVIIITISPCYQHIQCALIGRVSRDEIIKTKFHHM